MYRPYFRTPTHQMAALPHPSDTFRTRGLRAQLVELLRKKGITHEAVLAAIGKIPRHAFLDKAFLEQAYEDKAMPIGEGQTISQPYTVAFQSALLGVAKRDKILEIGTGSGYQAAVLLELGARLQSIERQKALFEKTSRFLPTLGYGTQKLMCGDGTLGWPAFAPYQGIIVTAGAPAVPEALVQQLAVGGRLIIPVGDAETQQMQRLTKQADGTVHTEHFELFKFVPLVGKQGW